MRQETSSAQLAGLVVVAVIALAGFVAVVVTAARPVPGPGAVAATPASAGRTATTPATATPASAGRATARPATGTPPPATPSGRPPSCASAKIGPQGGTCATRTHLLTIVPQGRPVRVGTVELTVQGVRPAPRPLQVAVVVRNLGTAAQLFNAAGHQAYLSVANRRVEAIDARGVRVAPQGAWRGSLTFPLPAGTRVDGLDLGVLPFPTDPARTFGLQRLGVVRLHATP